MSGTDDHVVPSEPHRQVGRSRGNFYRQTSPRYRLRQAVVSEPIGEMILTFATFPVTAGGGVFYLARVFFFRPVAIKDTADVAGMSF
jgi:hypothetical protein